MPINTIPARDIVAVNPQVVSGGGASLGLNGLCLTNNTRVPIGAILTFASAAAVSAYFGATSVEAAQAAVYFNGFDNSDIKPSAMLFSQYPTSNVAAYLRGSSLASVSLTALQAYTGVLTVTIDGVLQTSGTINLAGATSFSNAAQLINRSLGATGATNGTYTGSISGTTLTVTAVLSGGPLAVGQVLSGSGVAAGTYITAFLTGAGTTGTYTVSDSQTVASTTITATNPVVTYDSIAQAFVATSGTTGSSSTITYGGGSIATNLGLTQAAGAILSQGAVAATPSAAMTAITQITQNWATFFTTFEPNLSDKVAFALWTAQQNNRYGYVMFETGAAAKNANDTTLALYQIVQAADSGVFPIYEPSDLYQAAMVSGFVASVDFTRTNGRADFAFRSQSGMTPGVTNQTDANNLLANSYNYYGTYATAAQQFNFIYAGTVTGPFDFFDSYINQIWLNAALQQAIMILLTNVKSIPYNDAGYALLAQACQDPVNAALNAGVIRSNVPLSALQAAEVNNAAGKTIDGVLSSRGWYLLIQPASALVRSQRGSPPMTLWYMDGESIQKVTLASVNVQ